VGLDGVTILFDDNERGSGAVEPIIVGERFDTFRFFGKEFELLPHAMIEVVFHFLAASS
jgi:hypothetical protein